MINFSGDKILKQMPREDTARLHSGASPHRILARYKRRKFYVGRRGEILKCKARLSRFLNFKRRKGFAVKKFGSRTIFAKAKGLCGDRSLTERKNFAAVDEILRRVQDRAARSVTDARVCGINSGQARGLTATDVTS